MTNPYPWMPSWTPQPVQPVKPVQVFDPYLFGTVQPNRNATYAKLTPAMPYNSPYGPQAQQQQSVPGALWNGIVKGLNSVGSGANTQSYPSTQWNSIWNPNQGGSGAQSYPSAQFNSIWNPSQNNAANNTLGSQLTRGMYGPAVPAGGVPAQPTSPWLNWLGQNGLSQFGYGFYTGTPGRTYINGNTQHNNSYGVMPGPGNNTMPSQPTAPAGGTGAGTGTGTGYGGGGYGGGGGGGGTAAHAQWYLAMTDWHAA